MQPGKDCLALPRLLVNLMEVWVGLEPTCNGFAVRGVTLPPPHLILVYTIVSGYTQVLLWTMRLDQTYACPAV